MAWKAKIIDARIDAAKGVGNAYVEVELKNGDYVEKVSIWGDDLSPTFVSEWLGKIVASRDKRDAALAELKALVNKPITITPFDPEA